MLPQLRFLAKERMRLDRFSTQATPYYNQPFPLKQTYHSIIPLKVFQTWGTKDLPPKMKENLEKLKQQNSEFEFFLFDDTDCREFIATHFEKDVLEAYDTLLPGAYKADLWRLCVLYIHGGIYIDIKLRCINNFKLIELTEAEHFVKDRGNVHAFTLYNALMVCQSKNMFLMEAIKKIVNNVKIRYYGLNSLHPTGPFMLGDLLQEKGYSLPVDMFLKTSGDYVVYKQRFILETSYPEYREEQKKFYLENKTHNYDSLWGNQLVYKKE